MPPHKRDLEINWADPKRTVDIHAPKRPTTTDINHITYISQRTWDEYVAATQQNEKGTKEYKNAAAAIAKFDELRVMYEESDGQFGSRVVTPGCSNCQGKGPCRVFNRKTRANHTAKCGFCRRNNKTCNVWEMNELPPPTMDEHNEVIEALNTLGEQVEELQRAHLHDMQRIAALERNIADLRRSANQGQFRDPETPRRRDRNSGGGRNSS